MSDQAVLPVETPIVGEMRRFWPVVLACFCVAVFAWGFGFYGQAVYFAELQQAHGWSASLIASATTIYYLAGAVLLSQVHRVVAAIGSRMMLCAGVVVMGIGVIGVSRVQAPWQLYFGGLVMAAGWACSSTTAIATTLAQYFDERRGLAISLALNGASAGGFLIAPALVQLTHRIGLAASVPLVVAVAGLVVLPVILMGVGPIKPDSEPVAVPRRSGAAVAATHAQPAFTRQAELLRDVRFWSISLPFALALAAQVGFIVHQVAFLLPRLGTAGTGVAVASTAIAATVGRLTLALVIDRLNQRAVAAGSFASQAGGLALMLAFPEMPHALYVGSVVFGLSVGNVITLPSLIVQHEFAARSFSLVIGLSSMIGQAALAFGPTLLGLAHDWTGGYGVAILLCIGLQMTAAVIVLLRVRPACA